MKITEIITENTQGVAEGSLNENADVLAGLTDILKIAATRQAPQNPRYFAQQVKDVALQLKDNPATQKWASYLDGVVRWADVIANGKEQYSSGFADEVHNVLGPATRAYQDALLNKQGVSEGTNDFSRNVATFRLYQHLDPMEFYNMARTPQGLAMLAKKAGTTPESVKDSLERLDWGQFPADFYQDDEEQGVAEASGNAAKMARVAKMCARQAFKDTDRPDSKMFLKAAEYFAAGDEKKGLATIARMDTEARDDFHMGCEDAGIPIPTDDGGRFHDSLPDLELTPAQKKYRKAMHKALGLSLDEDSTK